MLKVLLTQAILAVMPSYNAFLSPTLIVELRDGVAGLDKNLTTALWGMQLRLAGLGHEAQTFYQENDDHDLRECAQDLLDGVNSTSSSLESISKDIQRLDDTTNSKKAAAYNGLLSIELKITDEMIDKITDVISKAKNSCMSKSFTRIADEAIKAYYDLRPILGELKEKFKRE